MKTTNKYDIYCEVIRWDTRIRMNKTANWKRRKHRLNEKYLDLSTNNDFQYSRVSSVLKC